mgnify:CR=1 FL=1
MLEKCKRSCNLCGDLVDKKDRIQATTTRRSGADRFYPLPATQQNYYNAYYTSSSSLSTSSSSTTPRTTTTRSHIEGQDLGEDADEDDKSHYFKYLFDTGRPDEDEEEEERPQQQQQSSTNKFESNNYNLKPTEKSK